MVPAELLQERDRSGIVYLPVGSMEWHGPHMGMGMDTCNAYAVSLASAQRTGGVVFPPLYIGTETPRSPETLKKLGFSGREQIVGMDFPDNTVRSFYWPPALFESILRTQTEMLCRMGYATVVLVNGHGADAQIEILERIARECSAQYNCTVVSFFALQEGCGVPVGHAALAETSIMQAVCPEGVELDRLPPKPEKLVTRRWGIADNETFTDGPNADYTVRQDPRDAAPETGQRIIAYNAEQCAAAVLRAAHRKA